MMFLPTIERRFVLFCGVLIIGYAAKNIPAELRRMHPETPWKEMAEIRDKITHFYFNVDMHKVWLALKEDIRRITPQI